MRKFALLGVIALGLTPLGGCALFQSIGAEITGTATAAQQQIVTNFVNGQCEAVAALLDGTAVSVDTIVQPKAASGGTGASTLSTITKVGQLSQTGCAALNGLQVTATNGATATAPAAASQ